MDRLTLPSLWLITFIDTQRCLQHFFPPLLVYRQFLHIVDLALLVFVYNFLLLTPLFSAQTRFTSHRGDLSLYLAVLIH